MAPRQIPVVKSIIRATQIADAERLLAQALTMSTETEIEELVYGAMNRALPARAHRRRRGPTGGVSPRGQVAVRPARPEDWLAVQSLLRELDELHAELVPEYFRPGHAHGGRMAAPARRCDGAGAGRARRGGGDRRRSDS